MPVADGQLARHDAGARADAVVEQLEQVVAFTRPDRGDGKVVDDEHADPRDRCETLAEAAVGMAQREFFEQALLEYIESDGSLGVHNPAYVRAMLDRADELLDDEGI